MEATFKRLVNEISQRQWGQVEDLLPPRIRYNKADISAEEFVKTQRGECEAIPDLALRIDTIVKDDSSYQLGARLLVHGTLGYDILGHSANRAPVSFAKHIFAWYGMA